MAEPVQVTHIVPHPTFKQVTGEILTTHEWVEFPVEPGRNVKVGMRGTITEDFMFIGATRTQTPPR